jgi:hypothetical protein
MALAVDMHLGMNKTRVQVIKVHLQAARRLFEAIQKLPSWAIQTRRGKANITIQESVCLLLLFPLPFPQPLHTNRVTGAAALPLRPRPASRVSDHLDCKNAHKHLRKDDDDDDEHYHSDKGSPSGGMGSMLGRSGNATK